MEREERLLLAAWEEIADATVAPAWWDPAEEPFVVAEQEALYWLGLRPNPFGGADTPGR